MRNFKPMNRQGGWIQVAGIALSAIGALSSFVGSQRASDAAKRQAKEEARMESLVTREKLRQLNIEERVARGETIAGYAGSGVLATGNPKMTPSVVLAEQANEFLHQKNITSQVGATRAQNALAKGNATATAFRYQGYANTAQQLSSMFTQIGKLDG